MELDNFDNRNFHKIESEVPEICKTEPCLMGIDEAGRGPVLGPMVYAASYCPISKSDMLKATGFADSKTLNETQREGLFKKLNEQKDSIGWAANILSPNYISNSMLKRCKYNLNQLSHDTAIGLIQKVLDMKVNLKEVYLDTVGDASSYEKKIKEVFVYLDVVVSKKADSIYPIVSAASICAKVLRDKVVKEWKFIEGNQFSKFDYGSGYPGDPKTKDFLAKNLDDIFGFPQFVRFSWSTAVNILEGKATVVKWEDDDGDDENDKAMNTPHDGNNNKRSKKNKDTIKNVPAISNFFVKSLTANDGDNNQSKKLSRKDTKLFQHRFFATRGLKGVEEFF